MDFNIATHFSHGGKYGPNMVPKLLDLIEDSGAEGVRDGLGWNLVERMRGKYDFSDHRTNYFDMLKAEGLQITLTLMPMGNRLYDKGRTVTSDKGVKAFAEYVNAVLDRFPEIDQITIGNEFNGLNSDFVNGKAASSNLAERAASYTKILKAVHDRISDDHGDVQINGGALHSIATGYVSTLIEAGAFAYMDSLDVHPYGQRPEEVAEAMARLNEVLDTLPADQRPHIVVTEFGQSASAEDPLANASFMAKMAAVMADAGVTDASWYALLDEDTSGTPDMGLHDTIDTPNIVSDAYRYIDARLDSGITTRLEAGPGVQLYRFGDGTHLAWGSQEVTFTGRDLVFRDVTGAIIDRPDRLGDTPVFIEGSWITVGTGDTAVLGDSFYDFRLDPDPDGPWSYFGLVTNRGTVTESALTVMDGQTRIGESWTPYLGNSWWRPFQMSADTLRPVDFNTRGTNERATLERFTVAQTGPVDIVGSWSVSAESTDGVRVEIRLNGRTLETARVSTDTILSLRDVQARAGDEIDFIVHDGGQSKGDAVTRHIRVHEADPETTTEELLWVHAQSDIIDTNDTGVVARFEPETGIDASEPGKGGATVQAPDETATSVLRGTTGDDSLVAGDGDDSLIGQRGDDTLRAGNGDDTLEGNQGNDTILGENGNDILNGGLGHDRADGGRGNDVLIGADGNDTLIGAAHDDLLRGGDGLDKLTGGAGNDTLEGGAGIDVLRGGWGADLFVFGPDGATDQIKDFRISEGDVLDLRAFDLDGIEDISLRHDQKFDHLEVFDDGAWVEVAWFARLVPDTTAQELNDLGLLVF